MVRSVHSVRPHFGRLRRLAGRSNASGSVTSGGPAGGLVGTATGEHLACSALTMA
nr:hypothetical protein [Candidatus Hamiltonella defensa]